MTTCAACGQENRAGARFCDSCGAPLASPETRELRKVVTILFCDVTGSTALGERLDSESLRRVMERYFAVARSVLERHGGTVEKFIGDAVMAVFGIPVVHEDDALRGARAAAELREELTKAKLFGQVLGEDEVVDSEDAAKSLIIVGTITDGVVVEIGNGFMQVVQHLSFPIDVGLQHVLRQLQRQTHRIPIVVMRHIMAPINEVWIILVRMGQMPFVKVHHAIATIDFNHRRDERDHVVANRFDVGTVVDGETISQFHQRRGRAGFG